MWWQWLIFALIIIAIPYGLYNIKKLEIKRVKPVDQFPMTVHVESVVLLSKRQI